MSCDILYFAVPDSFPDDILPNNWGSIVAAAAAFLGTREIACGAGWSMRARRKITG